MKKQLTVLEMTNVISEMLLTFKSYKSKVIDQWNQDGLIYGKYSWSGHTYIEFGFQKFSRKVSFFIHCRIPENVTLQKQAKDHIEVLINMHPEIEVFYDDEFEKDYNNGKYYNENTHKVEKLFKSKSATQPIDEMISIAEGGAAASKYAHKNARKSIDYDFMFQNL